MDIENETLVKDIQNSFLRLLNDYLPKPLLEKTNLKILNISCGRFREAKSIFDYFKDHGKLVKLYGIDNDKNLLELAKNEEVVKNNKNSVFLKCADATKIENYKDWLVDGPFDLVIVRHPEITFNTEVFIQIFKLIGQLLSKDGYLLSTTHFENEKEALKLLLKLSKFNLLLDIENTKAPSFKIGTETRFVDKFLLIASKESSL